MATLAGISQALATVQGNMNTRLPGLTHKVGRRFVATNRGGNSVVWVPLRDTFEAGRQQPGVRRVTRVRVARFEVHLWGVPTKADGSLLKRGEATPSDGRESLAQTDLMLNVLACALEDSAKACQYELEDGAWEDTQGDSVSDYGLEYIVTISLRVPVVYDALVTTPVTEGTTSFINADDSTTTPPP